MKLKDFIKLAESKGATLEAYNELGGYELTRGDIVDPNPVLVAYMQGAYNVEISNKELESKELTELVFTYKNISLIYPKEKALQLYVCDNMGNNYPIESISVYDSEAKHGKTNPLGINYKGAN